MRNLSIVHFASICTLAILLLATVVVGLLKRKAPQNPTYQKVSVIVRSWWLIAGLFLGALSLGFWGLSAFFYLITLLGIREYLRLSQLKFKKAIGTALVLTTT